MQKDAADQLEKIFADHERSKSQLEAQRQKLELVEKELEEREALNTNEKRKLDIEKKMVLYFGYYTKQKLRQTIRCFYSFSLKLTVCFRLSLLTLMVTKLWLLLFFGRLIMIAFP